MGRPSRLTAASQVGKPYNVGSGGWGINTSAVVTALIDAAISQELVLTGQLTTASEIVTLESYLVELLEAA
jgi:hypothetical protein